MDRMYTPKQYTLLTHLRDIYMCGRVQQVALGNPDKTLLILVGACHTFGVHEFIKCRIPQNLMNVLANGQKNKKHVKKVLKKYGASFTEPLQKERLPKTY